MTSSSAEDALKFLESLEGDIPTAKVEPTDVKVNKTPQVEPITQQEVEKPKPVQQESESYKLPTSFSFNTINSALKGYLKDENVMKAKENVSKNVSSIASAFISSFNVPPSMQIKCIVIAPFPFNSDTKYTLQEIWGNATKGRWSIDFEYKENHKTLFSNNWNELVSVVKADFKPQEGLVIQIVVNEIKWMDAEFHDKEANKEKPVKKGSTLNLENPQEMNMASPLPEELLLEGYVFMIKVLDITEVGLVHGRHCKDHLHGLIDNALEQCGRDFQKKYSK